MATQRIELRPKTAEPIPSVTIPQKVQSGTNVNVQALAFPDAATTGMQWLIPYLPAYGSGSWTVKIRWYAESGTTGDVVWKASVAKIAVGDAVDTEAKAWDAGVEQAATTSGTAKDIVETSITLTTGDIDGAVTGDSVWIKIERIGASGSDTMTVRARMVAAVLEYSDT